MYRTATCTLESLEERACNQNSITVVDDDDDENGVENGKRNINIPDHGPTGITRSRF